MKMPFGKHIGWEIEELTSDYLAWLAKYCNNDEIAQKADAEYRWRDDHHAHWHGD